MNFYDSNFLVHCIFLENRTQVWAGLENLDRHECVVNSGLKVVAHY